MGVGEGRGRGGGGKGALQKCKPFPEYGIPMVQCTSGTLSGNCAPNFNVASLQIYCTITLHVHISLGKIRRARVA